MARIKNESITDVNEKYRGYIERLIQSDNSIVIDVKIANLTNNSDISRLKGNKSPYYNDYI